ncbi:hypothetical protein E2C01_072720 [Portunus trituberculatus]|uniref:DUF5641 domain-containing protein n=1 Tax=Portunus trituberculatus TaxID=210409 RepID=A0A5B7I8M0_PORTR|nr:hypothetical protein [Portunus trituberculatus]
MGRWLPVLPSRLLVTLPASLKPQTNTRSWREVQGWLMALHGPWNFSVVEILEEKQEQSVKEERNVKGGSEGREEERR